MLAPNDFTLTETIPADPAGIARAAALIRVGKPVAVPTETVYGLAADATSGEAVARIYQAKRRPGFNPLITHVLNVAAAKELAMFDETATRLATRFWPGPLTMVLPARPRSPIAGLVTAGLATVAIRCPAHPVMRALIAVAGRPLAAPSANASGTISPTTAAHVATSLGGRIPLILDGGPTQVGIESTIVAVEPTRLRLLRPGSITQAMLADATGLPIHDSGTATIESPGQLASHYAPTKPLRLNAVDARADEWLIGFGPVSGDDTLSATGDPIEAAARLFAALHTADRSDRAAIAVAPIPATGLGHAINDRLQRASAPR